MGFFAFSGLMAMLGAAVLMLLLPFGAYIVKKANEYDWMEDEKAVEEVYRTAYPDVYE